MGHLSFFWTRAEDLQLNAFIDGGAVIKEIASSFPGRSASAVKQRFNILLRARGLSRRKPPKPAPLPARRPPQPTPFRQEPPSLPRHASLTGALFGDPLPGRSALDRRQSR